MGSITPTATVEQERAAFTITVVYMAAPTADSWAAQGRHQRLKKRAAFTLAVV